MLGVGGVAAALSVVCAFPGQLPGTLGPVWLAVGLGALALAVVASRRLTRWTRAVEQTMERMRDEPRGLTLPDCGDPLFARIFDACLVLAASVSTRKVHAGLTQRAAPAALDALASSGIHWSAGWARCEVPLYVSEPASEEASAQDPQALGTAVTAQLDLLLDGGAVLDGHRWGEVVAFFPPAPSAATMACRAALQCREVAGASRLQVAALVQGPVAMGELVEGGLTVVGPATAAARLLLRTARMLGAGIVGDESIHRVSGKEFAWRRLGKFKLGWRKLELYELVGVAGLVEADDREFQETYHRGLAALESRAWNDALSLLKACSASRSTDGPSRVLLNFAQRFKHNPPPRSWDGTLVLGPDA